MIKRTDGKWWSDKAPQFLFDTLDLAREFDDRPVVEEPKAKEAPKVSLSLGKRTK